jgi:hypothetical protein
MDITFEQLKAINKELCGRTGGVRGVKLHTRSNGKVLLDYEYLSMKEEYSRPLQRLVIWSPEGLILDKMECEL